MSSSSGSIWLLIVFTVCLSSVFSEPSVFFSQENAQTLARTLISSQKKDGSWLGLKNTFFATSSLHKLNEKIPQKELVCKFLSNSKVVDAESAFYYVGISQNAKCSDKIPEGVFKAINTALETNSVWEIYHAASAAFSLKEKNNGKISETSLISAISSLAELSEDDGTFKYDEESEESSALNAGLAFQVFAQSIKELKLPNELKEKIEEALENSNALETEANGEFADKEVGSLRATATIFKGINDLAVALNKDFDGITGENVVSFAEFFMKHYDTGSAESAYFFLSGLETAANNKFGKPLVASLLSKSLLLSSKSANVKMSITDLYGKQVDSKVILVKVTAKGEVGGNLDISNQEIAKSGQHYEINLKSFKPEPGLYHLEVRVLPKDSEYQKIDSAIRELRIVGSASVSDLQIKHLDSKDPSDIIETYSASYPSSIKETLKLQHFQYLQVEFKVFSGLGRSIDVQQAFLTLTHVESGREYILIAQKKKGGYQAQFGTKEIAETFFGSSGHYELSLVLGDAFIESSFLWKILSLQIQFSKDSLFVEPEGHFEPKPEITWTFREPEKRPSKVISTAFTAAVLFPILIFLFGLLKVGANIKNFPFGTSFLSAVSFQLCIGLVLTLYVFYWFQLTMIQTLLYLGILLIPTFFFGSQTLNYLAKRKTD